MKRDQLQRESLSRGQSNALVHGLQFQKLVCYFPLLYTLLLLELQHQYSRLKHDQTRLEFQQKFLPVPYFPAGLQSSRFQQVQSLEELRAPEHLRFHVQLRCRLGAHSFPTFQRHLNTFLRFVRCSFSLLFNHY